MFKTFNTSATTQSTLGNADWNGEIGDIRESIRKVKELANKHLGKGKLVDLIIFTPEAFAEIEQHLFRPGMSDRTAETINGIMFEVVAGDTPAMLQAMQKACLGERVMLVTKGEVGLCVRQYYFPDNLIKPYSFCGGGDLDPRPRIKWGQ